MTIHKVLHLTETDYIVQEKKEEDTPALKMALIIQYKVSQITLKRTKNCNLMIATSNSNSNNKNKNKK